jgi:hypothetical protein
VCGTDVPRRAFACPECGADHLSGWREESQSTDGLDLPDDDFDYEEFTRREFGGGGLKPPGIHWLWWIAAILVLLALIGPLLRGVF